MSSAPTKTPPQTKTTSKGSLPAKSWWQKILPFIACQIIAILLVEVVLYFAGIGEEEIFKLDPELGFVHMQNKRITWRQEGFAQSYFNYDGMREPNISVEKPAGVYRVALLGDSLVESIQVPIEATFGQIIENDLKRNRNIQILNFATSGYSTAQEYIQLKKQVLKYHPDLVILGYNSRDMFENWSAADQVVTDVRPFALHLPNGNLIVNNFPVTNWLKTPRARFLQSIGWIRNHSHIWGIIAAWELDQSIHNSSYREFLNFITHPKKIINDWLVSVKLKKPRENKSKTNVLPAANAPAPTQVKNIDQRIRDISKINKPTASIVKPAIPAPTSAPAVAQAPAGNSIYVELVTRTMGSLIKEMKKTCLDSGAKLAVLAVPSRSALCPNPGMDTAFCDINYKQEVAIVSDICQKQDISLIDCTPPAEKLSIPQREALFYSAHLNPDGQKFVASVLAPFIAQECPPAK